jgi:hypothetical protein
VHPSWGRRARSALLPRPIAAARGKPPRTRDDINASIILLRIYFWQELHVTALTDLSAAHERYIAEVLNTLPAAGRRQPQHAASVRAAA